MLDDDREVLGKSLVRTVYHEIGRVRCMIRGSLAAII